MGEKGGETRRQEEEKRKGEGEKEFGKGVGGNRKEGKEREEERGGMLKTYVFHKSFPADSLPASRLTPCTDFMTGPFLLSIWVFCLYFLHCSFLVPCFKLSWLFVSF